MKTLTVSLIVMASAMGALAETEAADLRVFVATVGYGISAETPLGTPDRASARIFNDGSAPSGPSHIKVCSVDVVSQIRMNRNPATGQGWCGTGGVPPLGAKSFVDVEFPMPTRPCEEGATEWYCYPYGAIPGWHQICGIADSKNEVAESDETNNVKCIHRERARPTAFLYLAEEVSP